MNKITSVLDHIPETIKIYIFGDNNEIQINTTKHFVAFIQIGDNSNHVNNCKIILDENSECNGIEIFLFESGSEAIIGKNCLLSNELKMYVSDTHTLIDLSSNKILNAEAHKIIIHDNVWISRGVALLKNVEIASNNIIGLGAVVTKSFLEENCVIAGNPARIVKRNVTWKYDRPETYKNNLIKNEC